MAIGEARGETRAVDAAHQAISSPLLDIDINGARGVLFNITGGLDLTLYEVNEAADIISKAAHPDANIIFGAVQEAAFDGKVKITVIATGFDEQEHARMPQQPGGRMEYNRSMFYQSTPQASSGGIPAYPARQSQSGERQGYHPLPVTPPPLNAGRQVADQPSGRIPAVPAGGPPRMDQAPYSDVQGDFVEEDEVPEVQPTRLPVPEPEPEAQPLQRPAASADQRSQRQIRRMDPKALDIPRSNRNAPPGDVIDIPAFLRKR